MAARRRQTLQAGAVAVFHRSMSEAARVGRFHASELNVQRGAPPEPIFYYGHSNDFLARDVAGSSTFNGLALDTLEELEAALVTTPCIGLMAMSQRGDPGGAGRAIALFRRHHADREPILYVAWGLDFERAAGRALEYRAHAIIMGGMLQSEMFGTVIDTLRRVKTQQPLPATVEDYLANLQRTAPRSPFWMSRGKRPEDHAPGRYVDPDVIY